MQATEKAEEMRIILMLAIFWAVVYMATKENSFIIISSMFSLVHWLLWHIQRSKMKNKKEINLDGPQGNAYYILGCADELGKQLNFSKEKQTKIYEMTSGDYENLLEYFDLLWGICISLLRFTQMISK